MSAAIFAIVGRFGVGALAAVGQSDDGHSEQRLAVSG